MEDSRAAEAVTYTELRRLQNTYADIVTRRAWTELHDIMRPDCSLSLDLIDRTLALEGPAAIGEFIGTSLEQFSFFQFVVLNTVMTIEENHASTRMYMQEIRQDVETGKRTDAYGIYHDQLERDPDGRWWLTDRRYRSFARTDSSASEAELQVFELKVFDL